MKFNDMPYSRPDEKVALADLRAAVEGIKNAESAKAQLESLKKVEEIGNQFFSMESISYIRNTINTKDEFYDEERKFFDNVGPHFSEVYVEMNKALLNSKFRKELEAELGTLIFVNAELENKGFSPEIIPLMQEENTLCAEYQKLYASAKVDFQGKSLTLPELSAYKSKPDRAVRKAAFEAEGKFFDDNREKFDEIFDKLVKNRTEQARKLGFENYVELGYIRRGRNCYDVNGVANFRKQVLNDLVPVVKKLKEEQKKRIGIEDFKFYDDTFAFLDGNPTPKGTPDELLSAAKKMYTEMNGITEEFINFMYDNELFDVLTKAGKAPGGYCAYIEKYKSPFIFASFNGTQHDVEVLTHEAGHAFADFISSKEIKWSFLRCPSYEGAETHSMSMEFLTSPWHNLFFKEDTAKYELAHAEDALIFIPYGTMVDYFQQIIYTKPELTPQERNEVWADLEKQFRPYLDFDNLPFYGRGAGWQRQTHIYATPFYYIDYCMAQITALQVWSEFLKDKKVAWEKYYNFVKLGGTKTFIDLVLNAG